MCIYALAPLIWKSEEKWQRLTQPTLYWLLYLDIDIYDGVNDADDMEYEEGGGCGDDCDVDIEAVPKCLSDTFTPKFSTFTFKAHLNFLTLLLHQGAKHLVKLSPISARRPS